MNTLPEDDKFLNDVAHQLADRFNINHATIQLERHESDVICHQSVHCAD